VFDIETLGMLAVNDAALRKYGYTHEEFLAMRASDIRPPEDAPGFLEELRLNPDRTRFSGTRRHRRKDGTVMDVEVAAHRLVLGGRPAWLVVASDVTDRLLAELARDETEMRYRLVARATRDANWDWDLITGEGVWNEGVTTLFGSPCRSEQHFLKNGSHPDGRAGSADQARSPTEVLVG
jgi:PAS domain S-box-containing protein